MKPSPNTNSNSGIEQLLVKETYFEVINSFAAILFEAQSIDEIISSVTNHAMAHLNYYDCIIYLYDEEKDLLIQKAAYGPKNKKGNQIKSPIEIIPGKGIVGSVFSSGKGEIVNDTSKDDRYIIDDEVRYSEVAIPLTYKGKVIGVIDSEHPDKNFFNEQDFKILTTLAAMVSSKIEQAKADEKLKEYQSNLEKLVSNKTIALKKALENLEKTNKNLISKNKEKEVLLKEIHHRVKNNMQIITSLLNIQANSANTKKEKNLLLDCKDRILSMAIIHDRLYMEDDISKITFDEYIAELVSKLKSSFPSDINIEVNLSTIKINLSIDTAIPLGLILNELITNSLKHAFNKINEGEINVRTSISDQELILDYSDNGIGFNMEDVKTSFGLELIQMLVSQINGSIDYARDSGSKYLIKIPI